MTRIQSVFTGNQGVLRLFGGDFASLGECVLHFGQHTRNRNILQSSNPIHDHTILNTITVRSTASPGSAAPAFDL